MRIDKTERIVYTGDSMMARRLNYDPQGIYIRIDKTFLTERTDGGFEQQTVKEWLKALIKESVGEVMRGEK